jgi:hypothetical protein
MGVIGALIAVIITLIIIGVIFWAIQQLLPLIPLPEPFARIIYVLMTVVLVLIVLWVLLSILSAIGVSVPLFHSARIGSLATWSTTRPT